MFLPFNCSARISSDKKGGKTTRFVGNEQEFLKLSSHSGLREEQQKNIINSFPRSCRRSNDETEDQRSAPDGKK